MLNTINKLIIVLQATSRFAVALEALKDLRNFVNEAMQLTRWQKLTGHGVRLEQYEALLARRDEYNFYTKKFAYALFQAVMSSDGPMPEEARIAIDQHVDEGLVRVLAQFDKLVAKSRSKGRSSIPFMDLADFQANLVMHGPDLLN